MDYFSGMTSTLFGHEKHDRLIISHEALYYGIQYLHSGRIIYRIDHGPEMILEGPTVFLTYPGHYFEYRAENKTDSWDHAFICTFGSRVNEYCRHGLFSTDPKMPPVRISSPDIFLEKMQLMLSMCHEGIQMPPRAVLLFEELLLTVDEMRQTKKEEQLPHQYTQLQKLAQTIQTHSEKEYSWTELAKQHYVSETHFRRLFKNVTGYPPQQFQIHCRLCAAAGMLTHTGLSVGEIADQCGFHNVFYFSKLFKQKFQIPPMTYRRVYSGVSIRNAFDTRT